MKIGPSVWAFCLLGRWKEGVGNMRGEEKMLKNTPQTFGSIAKMVHWVMAFLIIGMLGVGLTMVEMPPSPLKMTVYGVHKSTGVLVLCLVILRLLWRFMNPVPSLPHTLHPWHHRVAKLSSVALYLLMFLMPISGFVMSDAAGYPVTFYNLYTLPHVFAKNLDVSQAAKTVHAYAGFGFVGILVLHGGAAFYHQFVLKTGLLKRMLPSFIGRHLR